MSVVATKILNAATATGAGSAYSPRAVDRSFQAIGRTTAGAGACAVKVQGSNDGGTTWIDIATISLTLSTTDATDGFASNAAWQQIRANVSSISGTGANVDIWMGH